MAAPTLVELDGGLQELDLGGANQGRRKEMGHLLKQIANKKQTGGIEQQAISLGFVQSLSKDISANKLAASGIVLSLKDSLLNSIRAKTAEVEASRP